MHEFEIAYDVANDEGLRRRIQGLFAVKSGTATPVERALLRNGADGLLAEHVAANPTILATVQTAVDGGTATVSEALDTVPDADLEYVVLQQLTFLQA